MREQALPEDPPRWRYRFDNFSRAVERLGEAIAPMQVRPLSDLENEGVVQRFEYTWELAWKVLKDYLDAQGVVFATVTPASVLRAALGAGLIDGGDTWMKALEARNLMSHSYSRQAFERTVEEIRTGYLAIFKSLHDRLAGEIDAEDRDG